ncbi:FHA domain-containing protein [Actibacterium pelagium]|uniref:FHA domain-containing protein n=1 Tax=Actibacterium pelagium TaxID=2029103 RepID=A0A917EG76_9RHOB|nr:FHA domain-containing protein [Actibacterium pelagium]GGE37327.1 hypothetical protein GCM10011517_01330 [Actibacterium pelagium]
MIRRKSTSDTGTSRGFSFDLVSRRKAAQDEGEAKVRSPLELLAETAPAKETPEVQDIADMIKTEDAQEASAAESAFAPVPRPKPQVHSEPVAEEPKDESPLFLSEPIAAQPDPAPVPEAPAAPAVAAEPEISPAPRRRNARVKTTFLGFERSDGRIEDIFAGGQTDQEASTKNDVEFPVGWLVISKGPGRGAQVSLQAGVSQIGRGDDQSVQLDFGDNGISRANHAAIAFDDEERKFFLGHGGKANIVRLNGKPVLSTEELSNGDEIRISETTLHFVALCGEDFTWAEDE